MGNMDKDATIKQIKEAEAVPTRKFVDDQGTIMYEYDVLNQYSGIEAAQQLLSDEMKTWIETHGYQVIDTSSREAEDFLNQMRAKVNARLRSQGYKADLGIGVLVMQERIDNDPRRLVNVIFAVVKSKKNQDMALLIHPVQVGEGTVNIANQHRKTGEFSPSVMLIEDSYPFGFRGGFDSVTSYPVKPLG